jgi:membrane protein
MFLPGRDISWKRFLIEVKDEFLRGQLDDVAGMLTFAGILALFPFLLFALSLGSHLITPAAASALLDHAAPVLPPAALGILRDRIDALVTHKSSGLFTLGALGALWAGSGGIAALTRALNSAYGVTETRPWWKVRFYAALATLLGAVFVLVSSGLAVVAPLVAGHLGPAAVTLVPWLRIPAAAVVAFIGVACAYRFLPDVEQRFSLILPGSILAVALWVVASLGFSVYAENFGKYEVEYGTLGGVIVLLLWMWISSIALLLGAEVNAVLEHASDCGKKRGARTIEPDAEPGRRKEISHVGVRPGVAKAPAAARAR